MALEIERSFWEKATILHAEYHRPSDKLRDRYSRHYADTAMLTKHPETIKAISNHDLLNKVVLWKSKFFSSAWANYDLAKPGTFRLVPLAERLPALRRDYQLMRDMYLAEPVSFDDIISILSDLEDRINLISESQKAPPEKELFQHHLASLPSLGEVLTKKRGGELVQSVKEILAAGADVNDTSLNGHRPLQLLIRANLEPHKKLELVKSIIELGADIHSADNSGLTPYQVAISEEIKPISDFLRYNKNVRPISPPGTGYAKHSNMYGEIPLP